MAKLAAAVGIVGNLVEAVFKKGKAYSGLSTS